MDSGLTSATVNTTPAPATPTPVAAPSPAPVPAPTPTYMPTRGGEKITDILKRINIMEVGFGVLGAAALFYTIYYYKYNLVMSKSFKSEIENKVDDLSMKVSDVQSAIERDKSQSATTPGFF